MHTRLFLLLLTACLMALSFTGCTKKDDSTSSTIETEAEYKSQADKEITKENLLDELDKLEKEVDQDSADIE